MNRWDGRKYSNLMQKSKDTECKGESIFCDYFWPAKESAFIDNGSKNAFNAIVDATTKDSSRTFDQAHVKQANDLVIVHYRILEPEIKVVDAKFSFQDKIANFGGKFGVFAQVTGCSFLGIINFLILCYKLIFAPRQNQK